MKYASIGGIAGGIIGGLIGYTRKGAASDDETSGGERTSDEGFARNPEGVIKNTCSLKANMARFGDLSEDLAGSLEKISSISSRDSKSVCVSIRQLLLQIHSAVYLLEREDGEVETNIRMAQQALNRICTVRQLLDKVYSTERDLRGEQNLEELMIYKEAVQSEMASYTSSLNNFLSTSSYKM